MSASAPLASAAPAFSPRGQGRSGAGCTEIHVHLDATSGADGTGPVLPGRILWYNNPAFRDPPGKPLRLHSFRPCHGIQLPGIPPQHLRISKSIRNIYFEPYYCACRWSGCTAVNRGQMPMLWGIFSLTRACCRWRLRRIKTGSGPLFSPTATSTTLRGLRRSRICAKQTLPSTGPMPGARR